MITLSRTQVRSLRRVFRRATLGLGRRGPVPPLVFEVANDRLHVRHRQPHLVVEHVAPLAGVASGPIALPLDALADLGRGHGSALALEATDGDRTIARWTDRGAARAREYVAPPGDGAGMILNPPLAWADPGPGLLDALSQAGITAGETNNRYDLGCLLLKQGTHGHEVVATDGRQALIQGGFRLPWDGDVLVRTSPIFTSRDLPRDEPWAVGRAGGHVLLRSGPWTLALAIRADARFPRVDLAFPDPATVATRLRLDPRDARGLPGALGRLPGDRDHAPVTLDLNGHVGVRARGDGEGPATELVLRRSSYSGAPVRLATCRAFLGRAAELGFGEVEVVDAKSPLVCRSGGRAYAWQPLDADAVIAPADDDVRVEVEPDPATGPAPGPAASPTIETGTPPVSARVDRTRARRPRPVDESSAAEPADPVAEAEELHSLLADARARARRLVATLRRQRRRDRQVRATLASLRQIRLPDAAR